MEDDMGDYPSYTKCLFCGSEKIVPNVKLADYGAAYSAVTTRLFAFVCADCGYTAHFAEWPRKLYEAYLEQSKDK
jgi:hypothetical protein